MYEGVQATGGGERSVVGGVAQRVFYATGHLSQAHGGEQGGGRGRKGESHISRYMTHLLCWCCLFDCCTLCRWQVALDWTPKDPYLQQTKQDVQNCTLCCSQVAFDGTPLPNNKQSSIYKAVLMLHPVLLAGGV